MNYLKDISTSLKTVQKSFDGIIDAEMFKNEERIKKWIRKRWLTGFDSNRNPIGIYRFEDYAEEKYAINSFAGFGNVDLTYSGMMGRRIEIKNLNDGYEVFSTVDYYDKIIDKYGDTNFNITDPEKEKLDNMFFNVIFNQIDKIYGK